ncbi:MAG: hypothetical protein HC802_18790 [Caldilineaceae bacterium]|nr:hypothetical protein [Caldilineaceae bacterium]
MAGARFVVDWIGRRSDETPGHLATDANGDGNYPIFIPMNSGRRDGIVFATAEGAPADRVEGMGLPDGQLVAFHLTFETPHPG